MDLVVIPAKAGTHLDLAGCCQIRGRSSKLEGLPYDASSNSLTVHAARDRNYGFGPRPPAKVMKDPCVYILASNMRGTLYVGVTSDLVKRVWQHRNNVIPGFTKKYRVHDLVWFEQHPTMESAIRREKALKEWQRLWKIRLIEESNPTWVDRFGQIMGIEHGSRPSPG